LAQVFRKILRSGHRTLIHRGEDCKDFLKKKHGNRFCMHVEEHLNGFCMLQILCLCLWQICSMFWPKELDPISKDRYTMLNILFFLMDLLLKKLPWSLVCCFFFGFNTSSHWHGSIVS
jgi:hypothetical protein